MIFFFILTHLHHINQTEIIGVVRVQCGAAGAMRAGHLDADDADSRAQLSAQLVHVSQKFSRFKRHFFFMCEEVSVISISRVLFLSINRICLHHSCLLFFADFFFSSAKIVW